jgi:hypothetical protein
MHMSHVYWIVRGSLQGKMALSAQSELTWLAFTDRLIPVSMDSKGLVQQLHLEWGMQAPQPSRARARRCSATRSVRRLQWMPILDTALNKKCSTDVYWPKQIVSDEKCVLPCVHGGVVASWSFLGPVSAFSGFGRAFTRVF